MFCRLGRRFPPAAVVVALACLIAANAHVSASAARARFRVAGSAIIGPNGLPFVIRGVNVSGLNGSFPHAVTDWTHLIVDVWRFDTIRVNCNIVGSPGSNHDNDDLGAIVRAYTDRPGRKAVVILADHDHTGEYFSNNPAAGKPSLDDLSKWFATLARRYRGNGYVWFNVANEPGPLVGNEHAWLVEHETVIRAIRATGNTSPIICDAAYWGQDVNSDPPRPSDSAILTLGPTLLSAPKPYSSNIVFSIHLYTEWTRLAHIARGLSDFFAKTNAAHLAVIVGEWADYSWVGSNNTTIDVSRAARAFFRVGPKLGIGRIYWSWFGSDNPLCVRTPDPTRPGHYAVDPVTGWEDTGGGWRITPADGRHPTNLTAAGELAWDDNHR